MHVVHNNIAYNLLLFYIYRIYHKSFSDDKFSVIETRLLWKRFDNLIPNSQYVFYVVTISGKNNELSLPSEKIVVWTHPAVSAIVDVIYMTIQNNKKKNNEINKYIL